MNKVVYTLGNEVSTDIIYPGRYMATVLPSETPQCAFAEDPEFNTRQASLPPAKTWGMAPRANRRPQL
jgi:3-isopropylmalate dehydratase small subunit